MRGRERGEGVKGKIEGREGVKGGREGGRE